jgi:Tol biopolymer transport system component
MLNVAEGNDGRLFSSGGDGKMWVVGSNGQREFLADLHDTGWLETCNGLIFFTSFETKSVTLNRVNEDGSHLVKLFSGDLSYPGCSPDGKFAYYVNRHRPQKVWRISADGGAPMEIGTGMGEGISSSLSVSPNGELLSCTFIQYQTHGWKLVIFPASGGPITRVFDVPGGTNRVRWSAAGTSLQYLVTQDGATNIWEQSLAGGKPKQLTTFNSGRIFDFNWSPRDKKLLFTRGDVTSDVVLLSNLR